MLLIVSNIQPKEEKWGFNFLFLSKTTDLGVMLDFNTLSKHLKDIRPFINVRYRQTTDYEA